MGQVVISCTVEHGSIYVKLVCLYFMFLPRPFSVERTWLTCCDKALGGGDFKISEL